MNSFNKMNLIFLTKFCALTFYGCALFLFSKNSSASIGVTPMEESMENSHVLRNQLKHSEKINKGDSGEAHIKRNKVIRDLRALLVSPDLSNRTGRLSYSVEVQSGMAGVRLYFEEFKFNNPNVYDGSCLPSFFMIINNDIATAPRCGDLTRNQMDIPATEGSVVELLIIHQRFNGKHIIPSWRILISQIPSANVVSNPLKTSETDLCGIKTDDPPTERTTTTVTNSQPKAVTWVEDNFYTPDCPLGKKCGSSKKQFKTTANKIINGREAKTWPWMVALGIFKDGVFRCFCGAAIIGRKYVATANHCVLFSYQGFALKDIFVAVRAHDLSKNETGVREYFAVETVIQHSEYYSVRWDMAVLKVNREFQYDAKCGPICLPWKTNTQFENAGVVITGWGLKASFGGGPSATLQEAAVHCIPNANCSANWISMSGKDAEGLIEPFMICCGGKSATCNGDSGSPVHVAIGSKWYLAGLVSFGSNYNCLERVILSVMSRATSFMDWLALSTALPSSAAVVTYY